MNLEIISAIAQIISSIAVLLTLIYLAVQTKQISRQTELNTKAILSSSRQETLNQELWVLGKLIEDPTLRFIVEEHDELMNIFGSDLSREQISKIANLYNAMFRIRENLWFQYTNGVLDEMTWNSYRRTFVSIMNADIRMKKYWSWISQIAMEKGFVEDVNNLLIK